MPDIDASVTATRQTSVSGALECPLCDTVVYAKNTTFILLGNLFSIQESCDIEYTALLDISQLVSAEKKPVDSVGPQTQQYICTCKAVLVMHQVKVEPCARVSMRQA